MRACPGVQLAGGLGQLHVHDVLGEPPLARPAHGAAGHPRPGPGGQLYVHGTKMPGGQGLGCMPEQRGLVARIQRVPGEQLFIITMSSLSAKMIPAVCWQARRYSCSS